MPKYEISCPITGSLNQIRAHLGVLRDVGTVNDEPVQIIGYYTFPVDAESEEDALKKAQSVFDELRDNGKIDCGDIYNIDRTVYENGDEYRCCGIAEQKNNRSIFTFTSCCLMFMPVYTLFLIITVICFLSYDLWVYKILAILTAVLGFVLILPMHLQAQEEMDAAMTAVQKSSSEKKKMKMKLILVAIATFSIFMAMGCVAIPSVLTQTVSHSC